MSFARIALLVSTARANSLRALCFHRLSLRPAPFLPLPRPFCSGGPPRAPSVAEEQRLQASLRATAELCRRGEYDGAVAHAQEAVTDARSLFGARHPVYAAAVNNNALVMKKLGKLEEAAKGYQEALGIYSVILPSGHKNVLVASTNLALCLRLLKRFDESAEIYRDVLAQYPPEMLSPPDTGGSSPGDESAASERMFVASVMGHLGSVLKASGDLKSARATLEDAVSLSVAVVGEADVRTASVMNDLALVMTEQNEFESAEDWMSKALAVRRTLLGDHHPDAKQSVDNMAMIFARREKALGDGGQRQQD